MPKFSPETKAVLWTDPFGLDVFPARDNQPPPTVDGRTVALQSLRRFLADLTFYRPGTRDPNTLLLGPPIPFQIPLTSIYVEWPDDEIDLKLPAIALLAITDADLEAVGLANVVDEDTLNVFAPNTIVLITGEYNENFALEIWADTKAHRRAMVVGIEQALSPFAQMAGLRFVMPDYYGQLCVFELQKRQYVDDEEAVRIRRRARLTVQLRYQSCALVNVNPMNPIATMVVDADEGTGEEVDLTDDSPTSPDQDP